MNQVRHVNVSDDFPLVFKINKIGFPPFSSQCCGRNGVSIYHLKFIINPFEFQQSLVSPKVNPKIGKKEGGFTERVAGNQQPIADNHDDQLKKVA